MKKVVTHTTSKFHTDDVFAVAVFDIIYDGDIEVVRTHDTEVIENADIVVDIGQVYDPEKGRFDHHQKGGAGARENGIEYASIGLVWKHYGEELCGSKEVAEAIDKRLIQPIDAHDNGQTIYKPSGDIRPYTLQDIIAIHRDYDNGEKADLSAFLKAVELAKFILNREIFLSKQYFEAKKQSHTIYENTKDKRIIIFDDEKYGSGMRISTLMEFDEPIYIVYPDEGRNSWRVKAVNKEENSFELRKPFPESWGGTRSEDAANATGVQEATFCHRGLFTCAATTKEGAIKLAEKALEN